jgi:hypothetical protein
VEETLDAKEQGAEKFISGKMHPTIWLSRQVERIAGLSGVWYYQVVILIGVVSFES